MEYSFSQTFGRGAIIFQNSPPPSLYSNSASNSKSRSRSRSRSFEANHEKSPTKEQNNNKRKKNQHDISPVSNQKFTLKRQVRSYSQMPMCYDSNIHKQRQIQMQAKIKNVDGINERMVNLIKQLKRDCSKQHKKIDTNGKNQAFGIDIQRVKDLGHKYSEKKLRQPLYRAHSSKTVKCQIPSEKNFNSIFSQFTKSSNKMRENEYRDQKEQLNFQKFNSKKYSDRIQMNQNKIDKTVNKKLSDLSKQRISNNNYREQIGNKILFKDASSKKDNIDLVKYENNYELSKKLNSLKGKIYTSEMYQSNGKKLNGINKQVTGSCQQNYIRNQNPKPFQFSREKEAKKQSNWLKNKVKTIESEVETNCFQFEDWDNKSKDEIQQISIVHQNFQIKERSKQQQESICMALFDAKDSLSNRMKYVNQVQSKQSSNFNSNYNADTNRSTGLQQKLQRISQKIENYQKKVQMFGLSSENYEQKLRFESKRKNHNQRSKIPLFENIKKDKNQAQHPKRKEKTHQRLHTPTWGCEQNKIPQQNKVVNTISCQFHEDKASNNKQKAPTIFNKSNNINMEKNLSRQNSNTALGNIYANKKEGNLYLQNSSTLKERMNTKLGLSNQCQRLSKQVQLDLEFRKAKKQFSKLPQEFQGTNKSKWIYLLFSLKSQIRDYPQVMMAKQIHEIKQIFELTDDEADPFYSISVQNLRDYQQVIEQTASAYLRSQQYFANDIVRNFEKETIENIFKYSDFGQQIIKLDQFTVNLSNAMKCNYKCRDVYLLYRRLQKVANVPTNNFMNLKNLIFVLAFDQLEKRRTLRFIDNSSNFELKKPNQAVQNLDTHKKSKDSMKFGIKSIPEKYLNNKENSHWKLQ